MNLCTEKRTCDLSKSVDGAYLQMLGNDGTLNEKHLAFTAL